MNTIKLLKLADILLFNPPDNWDYFDLNTCAVDVFLKNFHPRKILTSAEEKKAFVRNKLEITENLYQYIFCYKLYTGFKLEKYTRIRTWASKFTMRPCDVGIRIIDLVLQHKLKK